MFAPINYFSTSRGLETSDSNNGQWEHDFFSNWRRMSNIEFVQRNFEVTWRKMKTNVTSLRLLWRILRYIFSRCLRGGRRMMLLCWSRLLLSERHVQEMSQLPLSFSNDRSTYFTEGNVTYAHAESCHFEERTKTRQWDYCKVKRAWSSERHILQASSVARTHHIPGMGTEFFSRESWQESHGSAKQTLLLVYWIGVFLPAITYTKNRPD